MAAHPQFKNGFSNMPSLFFRTLSVLNSFSLSRIFSNCFSPGKLATSSKMLPNASFIYLFLEVIWETELPSCLTFYFYLFRALWRWVIVLSDPSNASMWISRLQNLQFIEFALFAGISSDKIVDLFLDPRNWLLALWWVFCALGVIVWLWYLVDRLGSGLFIFPIPSAELLILLWRQRDGDSFELQKLRFLPFYSFFAEKIESSEIF